MKPSLKPGSLNEGNHRGRAARHQFHGDDCRVYATPRIISDVEYTLPGLSSRAPTPEKIPSAPRSNWEHVGPALLGGRYHDFHQGRRCRWTARDFEALVTTARTRSARHARAFHRRRAEGARAAAQ